jgi:hypothetical protein
MATLEQRRTKRVEIRKSGHIVLKNGSGMRCVIRNSSPFGACLQVDSHFGVPQDIFLWIVGEKFKRPCRIVWRTNSQLGVLFTN